MKWNRIIALLFVAFTLLVGSWAHPGRIEAAKPAFFNHVYLLKDVKLYNSRSTAKKPVGTLKAGQAVAVVDSDGKNFTDGPPPKWYLVKTQLGNKWIKADDKALFTGTYSKENKFITTVYEMELHDLPGSAGVSGRIAPGKLHVTATIEYSPVIVYSQTTAGFASWYQIDTPKGKKWVRDPAYLEQVKPKQVDYAMKLTETERVYLYPFPVESASEELPPQVVQVTGEWTAGVGYYWDGYLEWIRIKLPQGERWIAPAHPTIANYRELNEKITLQTETRYFKLQTTEPNFEFVDWLPSGEYEAFEASGEYVHIHSDKGDVWVNPSRALLERPLGIVPTDEKIQLTKTSEYFQFPLIQGNHLPKGWFKPQTVQAYEKWQAEDGRTFYHFRTSGGATWVLVP